jgi:hydroxymethylpyrimidine pyrophosphatase-like HAD family hydrolase
MDQIKAIIVDIDGTIGRQGGEINPLVASMLRAIYEMGIIICVATGKGADAAILLARGMGFCWHLVIAESGALCFRAVKFDSPQVFEPRRLVEAGADLHSFFSKVGIDPYRRLFDYRGQPETYRPELKEGIITLFPPETDISVTEKWVPYFSDVIRTFGLKLKVQRHSDGCIDVVPSEVNKYLGVQEACRIYDCEPANILVGVDGVNDLELTLGTQVIAVGNAVPKIKEAAQKGGGFIANKSDGFGLAQGIAHYARKGAFGDQSAELLKEIKRLGLLAG